MLVHPHRKKENKPLDSGFVTLRDVVATDLPIFYEQQNDPIATYMADFQSRERKAFMAHWSKILKKEVNIIRTILYKGQVAGNIVCFEQDDKREVGYWLGQKFWGRGIATLALEAFLNLVKIRPLHAHVVKDNIGSRRVVEKCGFIISSEDREFSNLRNMDVEGYLYILK